MIECWKPISNWPYAVSTLGRVKRIGRGRGANVGRVLKTELQNGGYLTVHLSNGLKKQRLTIHRLVAKTFIVEDCLCEAGFEE
jgi:hypothetical protein